MDGFRAVIWDFGGVITSSPFDAFAAFEAERGLPPGFLRRVNATDPDTNAWAQLERSEIDAATFDRLFAEESRRLGHEVRGADVLPLLSGAIRPRMVAALDALRRAGFRLGCITNNARVGHGPAMAGQPERAQDVAAVLARFDVVLESSKVGVRKPDPRIYRMMLDALGLPAAACIYLDDLGINCKPAAALGMRAIKVASEDQALGELSALVGIPL
ncbi:MAG: HAD-IA family hydrolase [Sphingomonadaceae bacterium]|uniref:HAD-IA family hydrolase n=1 Tax=Thermaurantiacus sp. TaxID=2820283 RepID=UPI00298F0017|nr:HAD-IA family hydrolase [Thermaurantiacus sp.]MCS6987210.1 HAD-IA family hydrolase [Sphingomonadaceae bacterium]MDW8414430.1 HAD-IA family hydrolase [Thermaurantiacus sp.]